MQIWINQCSIDSSVIHLNNNNDLDLNDWFKTRLEDVRECRRASVVSRANSTQWWVYKYNSRVELAVERARDHEPELNTVVNNHITHST